ncbi:MAG: SMC family ATPase [Candidatus Heimdallarchaeota archaeon]|nr:SMC family ATPase [Candidatus Heimdallarchaeota archaeon]
MAFLRIDRLKLNNIRCFELMDISFKKGTNIITGENGAGKSTILTSIGFGLYGVKYLTNSGIEQQDLITTGKNEGQIDLHFATDKGEFLSTYKISKSDKPSWRIRDKTKRKNMATSITETRRIIQQLLGDEIDSNAFKNALCSVQGELTILLEATSSERKQQLNKILGLQEYDTTFKQMRNFGKDINEDRKKISENLDILKGNYEDPEPLEKKLKENNLKADENNKIIGKMNEELAKIKLEITHLSNKREEIIRIRQNIKNKKNEYEKNKNLIEKIQLEIKQSLEKIEIELNSEAEAKTTNFNLKNASEKISKQIFGLKEIKIKYSENQKTIEGERTLFKENEIYLNSIELDIGSILNKMSVDEVKKNFSEFEQKINIFDHELNSLNKDITLAQDQIAKSTTEYENTFNRIQKFHEDVENKLKIKSNKLTSLKERNDNELVKLQDRLSNNIQKYDTLIKSMGEVNSLIDTSSRTLDLLNNVEHGTSCPTCFQKFQSENITDLISIHKKKLLKHQNIKSEYEIELTSIMKEKDEFEKQLGIVKQNSNSIEYFQEKSQEIEQDEVHKSELEGVIATQNTKFSNLKDKLMSYGHSEKIKLSTEYDNFKKIIEQHEKLTDIQKELITKIKESKQRIDTSIVAIQSINLKVIQRDENSLNQEREDIDNQITLITNDLIPSFSKQRDYLKTEIEYGDDLRSLDSSYQELVIKFNDDELDLLIDKKEEIIDIIGRKLEETKSVEKEIIPPLKVRIQKAWKNKKAYDALTSRLDEIQLAMPHVIKINEVLSLLPQKLMSQITNAVSSHITQTMRRLIPGRGFESVIFDESGEIKLLYQGNQVDKKTLSGGEKTVLGVALRLALAQYVAPINFMILDEPTNHLDQHRVNEFIEIVDRDDLLGDKNGQLIIVTHREEFNRNANRTIRISVNDNLGRSLIIDESEA